MYNSLLFWSTWSVLVKCAITAVFLLGKTNQGMGLERCLWWDFILKIPSPWIFLIPVCYVLVQDSSHARTLSIHNKYVENLTCICLYAPPLPRTSDSCHPKKATNMQQKLELYKYCPVFLSRAVIWLLSTAATFTLKPFLTQAVGFWYPDINTSLSPPFINKPWRDNHGLSLLCLRQKQMWAMMLWG